MKIRHYFPLFAILCGILLLTGCGSNSGSGGDQTASPTDDFGTDNATGIDYVSAAVCIGCHEGFSWSAELIAEYLNGSHVVHLPYISQDNEADGCLNCHDSIGDGPELEGFIDPINIPDGGLAAVGCENCHGAGGDHYGVGPMPIAKPDYTICSTCHDEIPESHLEHHPEANFIGAKFEASRHFTANVRNEAICSKCHTDEGGKLYKNVTTRDQLLTVVFPVSSDAPIQCRTCHNPHASGGLLFEADNTSAEYATCVSCHMGDDAAVADDGTGGTDWDITEVIYHQDVYYRIITDTHSDDPLTTDTIEGYVIDPSSDRACRDCHDVHGIEEIRSSPPTNTINDQWSRSGHGGFIGDVKSAAALTEVNRTIEQTVAIKIAAVTSTEADAWVHYDWDAEDYQPCQECHTSTGVKNYLNDPTTYDANNNDFSHLVGWSVDGGGIVTSSGQNEMLYCWGCHSDNNGGLRNPGAITRPYTVDTATVTLPDVGNSNVCINCHGARGNMDSYQIGINDDHLTGDPTTLMAAFQPGFDETNVTEAHYLVASATIYQAQTRIGYEYPVIILDDGVPVDPYADLVFYEHNIIALNSDTPETGSGPCAACHMISDEGHTFNVVAKDGDGVITALKSTSCLECHDGEHGPGLVTVDTTTAFGLQTAAAGVALLEGEAKGFAGALDVLEAELDLDGLAFTGSYPYFSGNSWIDEGTFGAAHNFNYLHHEPGAYAHNRMYAKRLIFDSIDWLQNGTLTGTIDLTGATAETITWLGTTRP